MEANLQEVKDALAFVGGRVGRLDYVTWLSFISALANDFDDNTAVKIMTEIFGEVKQGETEYKTRHKLARYHVGTIFHHAFELGFSRGRKPLEDRIKEPKLQHRQTPERTPTKEANIPLRETFCNLDGLELFFPVMVNRSGRNKDWDMHNLTNCWEFAELSVDGIAGEVRAGNALIFAEMYGNQRKKENFKKAELYALDFDDGIQINDFIQNAPRNALLLYTTASHTSERHRFRVVMQAIGETFVSAKRYEYVIAKEVEKWKSDKACKDATRVFYGNTNTNFFIFSDGDKNKWKT